MRTIATAISLSAIFLASGCTTLADAQAAKGTGKYRTYNKDFNTVWNTTLEVVKESGLDLVTDNKEKGNILAQGAMSAFSYGENVAIFIEPIEPKVTTRVEVVNKRALATNITATNWSTVLLNAIDEKLK